MPEDGDNAETCRSSVIEKSTRIVELCIFCVTRVLTYYSAWNV
jgi:hypothetical protein